MVIQKGVPFKKICINCKKEFYISGPKKTFRIKHAQYCSQVCHYKIGHSNDTKKRISESLTGQKNHFYGKHHSEQTIELLREARKLQIMTPEIKAKIAQSCRKNTIRGEKHHNWKGGITPELQSIRNTTTYKNWRLSIFKRDNYTCQVCGVRGGTLNADHKKPFSLFPELRLDLSNGRTLCFSCHKNTPTFGIKLVRTLQGNDRLW